ncbi:MAG: phosphatase PAP2 family protein [Acidimicrobiia bacterium]
MTAVVPTARPARWKGARRLGDGRHLYWWIEICACLCYYAVYSTIRNLIDHDKAIAFHHATQLISLQQHLGINHEESLQQWALHWRPIVISMNYVYGSLHFIVTAGVGIYLYRRFTDDYPLWRNALALTTGVALVGFYSWPLMPPRLLPHHYAFVDTLAKYPTIWSFNSGAMSAISNQYAAMPSLHCAWSLWCACAMVPRVRSRWAKVAFACYPVLTVTAIVLTANHYLLDAVGGFAVFGIGYLFSWQFTRAGRIRPGRTGRAVEPEQEDARPPEPLVVRAGPGDQGPGEGAGPYRGDDPEDRV